MQQRRTPLGIALAMATSLVIGVVASFGLIVAALAPAVSVVALPSVSPSPAPSLRTVTRSQVAPGLALTQIIDLTDPDQPERIWVLDLDPDSDLTLDVALVRKELGGQGPLTRIAERTGAIAAVNGDYGIPTGRPLHLYMEDGTLFQTSLINAAGRNVAWTPDSAEVSFGKPRVHITATPAGDNGPVDIARWNDGFAGRTKIAGFSSEAAGVDDPPADACSVRLTPDAQPQLTGKAITGTFRVATVACREQPMVLAGGDDIVLTTPIHGTRTKAIQAFAPGERVDLSWSIGWPGVTDAIGGSALLLQDDQIVTTKCHGNYECWRHPRTGLGVTDDGHVLLVVVDGRREGWSLGMRREDLAVLMQDLGATDAMALDGGASSEMVVDGQVLNQPSGNEERRLMSAVVILPGPDPGERAAS